MVNDQRIFWAVVMVWLGLAYAFPVAGLMPGKV